MMGKKKTEEPPQENPLDKPQTLEELEQQAREEKTEDNKVMLEDESGDPEHEVTHSDELSADTDVKRVTKSQRKLQILVVFAVALLSAGGSFFYFQLEAGQNTGIGGTTGNVKAEDKDPDEVVEVPRGTFAFAAKIGSDSARQFSLADESVSEFALGASISSNNNSSPLQLSRNSLVRAVRTSSGIYVKNQDTENTFLTEQVASIGSWLLIPDGTKLLALVGSNLYLFNTTSGEGGEIAKNFTPPGSDVSRLNYSRDGTIHQYAKTGGALNSSVYDLSSGKVDSAKRAVIRLDQMGSFNQNSLSPDGTAIVFIANIGGNQTLQLLSLNSYVLRTIYLAETGNTPSAFSWSQDSNNLIVYESGSSPKLAELKVGTLQKQIIFEGSGSLGSPLWSPDKTRASFIQNGKLRAIEIETKEVSDLLDSVSASDITGWYQN